MIIILKSRQNLQIVFFFIARQPACFRDIYRVYSSMTYGVTMKDLCQRLNPQNLRINERKLVQFGLIEGLIRRIYNVSNFCIAWYVCILHCKLLIIY